MTVIVHRMKNRKERFQDSFLSLHQRGRKHIEVNFRDQKFDINNRAIKLCKTISIYQLSVVIETVSGIGISGMKYDNYMINNI